MQLDTLVQNIADRMKPEKAPVPVITLKPLLEEYDSTTDKQWLKHKSFCDDHYQRNLVHIDDNVEIRIICWKAGQKCRVHDHPEQGCLVKVLEGELQEECFKPDGSLIAVNQLRLGGLSYQIGKTGLHRISNLSNSKAVTLHIYSPPGYVPQFREL